MLWLLESGVFASGGSFEHPLKDAVLKRKHNLIYGQIFIETLIKSIEGPKIFHGSLNFARKLWENPFTRAASYCDDAAHIFAKQNSCDKNEKFYLNECFLKTTVKDFCDDPQKFASLIKSDRIFVRPKSSLKHFSGRVIDVTNKSKIDPKQLDYNYYYEDILLEIELAISKNIYFEKRFVVVNKQIVTSCFTKQNGIIGGDAAIDGKLEVFLQIFINEISLEDIFVVDVCLTDEGFKIIETNPFSGSDISGCDADLIVDAVSNFLMFK